MAELRDRRAPSAITGEDALTAPSASPASVVAAETLRLDGPWPNPVRDRARLTVTAPADGHVRVSVFDVQGREVQVAFDGSLMADQLWPVALDLSQMSAGTYLVVVDTAGERTTKTFTVLR